MKRFTGNALWGVLLIAVGLLFLLQTFVGEATIWSWLWAVVFAAGGIGFTWRFVEDRSGWWWAAIPGFTLLALAVLLALTGFGVAGDPWLGALFLAAIGLSFVAVYYARPGAWWAIIPAGVMLTLAVIALLSTWFNGPALGAILFFGFAATFGLLALLREPQRPMPWALIPAGVLAVIGVMILFSVNSAANYVWAVLMILAGIYLLFRTRGGGQLFRHG